MDSSELKRVRDIVARADDIGHQIARLKEVIENGQTAAAISFDFDEWSIGYRSGTDTSNSQMRTVCSASLLADLAEEFRSAFIEIVAKRLGERESELEHLAV